MFFVIVALIVIAVIVSFIFGSRRGGRGGGGAASGYNGSFGDHGQNGDGGGWFDRGEAMAVVVATVVGRRQLAARSLLTGLALKDSQKYRPPANRAFVYERIAKAKS